MSFIPVYYPERGDRYQLWKSYFLPWQCSLGLHSLSPGLRNQPTNWLPHLRNLGPLMRFLYAVVILTFRRFNNYFITPLLRKCHGFHRSLTYLLPPNLTYVLFCLETLSYLLLGLFTSQPSLKAQLKHPPFLEYNPFSDPTSQWDLLLLWTFLTHSFHFAYDI